MNNYWLTSKNRTNTIREINGLLLKFVGRKINPVHEIYKDMQQALLKFLKANPEKVEYLTKDLHNFKYSFEIDDQGGFITDVSFVLQS